MNLNEQHIIEGLKQGKNSAYKHLFDHHSVLLFKIAFSFLKDDFSAKTLVSDLFVNMYE
jgi:RNA polymerase sigma-70 factor (ECF subfamily)